MSAYVIAFIEVNDEARYDAEYVPAVGPLIEQHGGKVLSVAHTADTREGNWPRGRNIVIEFPDHRAAVAWYEDPNYEPLLKLRKSLSSGSLAIVEGI